MSHFRKKPVVIEAVQFHGSLHGHQAVDKFIGEAAEHEHFDSRGWSFDPQINEYNDTNNPTPDLSTGGDIEIVTLEGRMTADPGDWIIRGIEGEFYPCKPDAFAATFEAVEVSA